MPSNDNKSVNVIVRDGGGGSDIGCLGLFYVLVLAAPWFAPAISLGYYLGAILELHSLAVTIVMIVALCLNYAFLVMFIKKMPTVFALLGAAEVAAWAFWIMEGEFNFDIYWQSFLSLVAAMFGYAVFKALVIKIGD